MPSVKGTKCTNSSAKTIKRRSTFPAFKAHLEQWSYVMSISRFARFGVLMFVNMCWLLNNH